ncbi:nose resistant to fluoxetine protein 6-like isoform X2 [Daktulosphaira vitifoliae]|nr:nose resistant to fluoxetine protein 6-like isoform X2 [Daktulosphaira vitifoliae]
MGVYDECIDVEYPIHGQYCLADIKLYASTKRNFSVSPLQVSKNLENAWDEILGWVDHPNQMSRNVLKFGICIPESCKALDLENSLQSTLDQVFLPENVKAIASVNPIMCSLGKDLYPYTRGYYTTSGVFLIFGLTCCVATIVHIKYLFKIKKKDPIQCNGILQSFSIIKNGNELLLFDKDNVLNIFNGFKFVVMLFILFGHRFMHLIGTPQSYPKDFEIIYVNGPAILLTSMNLVDPYFFMSGFLAYKMLYPTLIGKGSFFYKIFMPIIYRIVRMLPGYIVVMAFTAQLLPHFGNGPFWQQKTWNEANLCKDYWWTNILFINNFIDVKYQCLIISWYVTCDVHFYILGVIILYSYIQNRKWGIGMLLLLICLSLILPFYITFITKLDGVLKVNIPFLENPRSSMTFNKIYRPSYLRATPFLVGIAIAFLVEKLKETKFKMSYKVVFIGTFFITVIGLWAQFYGAIFYKKTKLYDPVENALYASVSHCTWTVLACWLAVCHFTTGYGPLTKILSNRLVVPLGRLSYCVFLVNLTVMTISAGSQRLPTHFSFSSLINICIYDIFKSYLVGALLYFTIDAPLSDLIKAAFGRRKTQFKSKEKSIHHENVLNQKNTKIETIVVESARL